MFQLLTSEEDHPAGGFNTRCCLGSLQDRWTYASRESALHERKGPGLHDFRTAGTKSLLFGMSWPRLAFTQTRMKSVILLTTTESDAQRPGLTSQRRKRPASSLYCSAPTLPGFFSTCDICYRDSQSDKMPVHSGRTPGIEEHTPRSS